MSKNKCNEPIIEFITNVRIEASFHATPKYSSRGNHCSSSNPSKEELDAIIKVYKEQVKALNDKTPYIQNGHPSDSYWTREYITSIEIIRGAEYLK